MQDKKKIEQKMRKEYPPLKTARELEWGFKIRYTVVSLEFIKLVILFTHSLVFPHICSYATGLSLQAVGLYLTATLCRDKTKPNTAFAPENLTVLPGEKDLEPTLGEQVATWFRGLRK